MPPPSHVFFDLDGTLTDSLPGIEFAMRAVVREVLGVSAHCPPAVDLVGPPLDQMLLRGFPDLDEQTRQVMAQAFRRVYDNEGWRLSRVYDGVMAGLAELLSRGSRCHVITNKRWSATEPMLTHFGLLRFIEGVWCPGRPAFDCSSKSAALGEALTWFGARSEDVVMVGDSLDDLEAARSNGTAFVAVAYGYGGVHCVEGISSQRVLHSFETILEILDRPADSN